MKKEWIFKDHARMKLLFQKVHAHVCMYIRTHVYTNMYLPTIPPSVAHVLLYVHVQVHVYGQCINTQQCTYKDWEEEVRQRVVAILIALPERGTCMYVHDMWEVVGGAK